MNVTQADLFSRLYRWTYRQGENYTTEAFACLLDFLLKEETAAALDFVSWLCFGGQGPALGSIPTITTQTVTDHGTPDMAIDSKEMVAFIEVKVWSGLGDTQVERYCRLLRSRAAGRQKRLVLLTVDRVEDVADADVRCLRWHEVADQLQKLTLRTPVGVFLTREFVTFLREQIMTVEYVGWQLRDGVLAMRNLSE